MAAVRGEDLSPASKSADGHLRSPSTGRRPVNDYITAGESLSGFSTPGTPGWPRSTSNIGFEPSGNFDSFSYENFPPVERLTMFDFLENLALPQRLERMQDAIQINREKLRKQRQKLASKALTSKNNIVEELRKRVIVTPEERLDKYSKSVRLSVDRLGKRWNDAKTVTVKEKVSFVTAVLNIFISAYLLGAWPECFHYWYTGQLIYFLPLRWYQYHKVGFHYFLADLCYFVNMLLVLSIWFFPQSKRLFISTYCLAFGNNAVAIAMWRNSLVLHSLDKTTTLFIHIMPCATLHVLVHLIPKQMQLERFPAIHTIKYATPDAPEHYRLWDMIIWATLPYAIWQLSYHFLITVRKRAKIAAGRPTSFTWLRRSYRGNALGKFVLGFPESVQESVFMCIQYCYALLTMLPCPIWFWNRWASATFILIFFSLASWNGATYYIDVFGRRMEKELEQLRTEVARMSKSPEIAEEDATSPSGSPTGSSSDSPAGPAGMNASGADGQSTALDLGPPAESKIPPVDEADGLYQRAKSDDNPRASDSTTSAGSLHPLATPEPTPGGTAQRALDGGFASPSDMQKTTEESVTVGDQKNA